MNIRKILKFNVFGLVLGAETTKIILHLVIASIWVHCRKIVLKLTKRSFVPEILWTVFTNINQLSKYLRNIHFLHALSVIICLSAEFKKSMRGF